MSDLTPLMNWLTSLGPYGYLLAALVPLAVAFLRQRFGPLPTPVTPTPTPTASLASLAILPLLLPPMERLQTETDQPPL